MYRDKAFSLGFQTRPLRKPCDFWLNKNTPATTPFKPKLATERPWAWPPAPGTHSVGVLGLHSQARLVGPLRNFPPLLPDKVWGQSRGWSSPLGLTNYLAKGRDNIPANFLVLSCLALSAPRWDNVDVSDRGRMEYLGLSLRTSQSVLLFYLSATQDGCDLVSPSHSAAFWQKLELQSLLPPQNPNGNPLLLGSE